MLATIAILAAASLLATAQAGNVDSASPRAAAASRITRQVPAQTPAAYRLLTSILGVLRRPQSRSDFSTALRKQLHRESRDNLDLGFFGTPVVSLVRLATVAPWGQRIFLIPHLPPTRQQIAKLPAKWRRGGTRVAVLKTVAVAFYPLNGRASPAVIEGGRAFADASKRGNDYPGHRFVMLLPDGVAKVVLWNTTSIRAHPHPLTAPHSTPVLATVHNNVAAFRSTRLRSPGREIWYGPSGKIIKRIANASSCAPPLGNCA